MNNDIEEAATESSANFTAPFLEAARPHYARSRYMWIGLFGIALNGTAILYLSLSRKVKSTLRVTMIGLSLNDLIFNADLVMLGYPNWTLVSHASECWMITFVMIASVIVSHLITIQLSLHNYLAVFHPFHSNVVLSVFRCAAAVVAGYSLGYLLALGCLGLSLDPSLPCYVLAVVPRSGLAIACGTCLSFSLVVVSVNLKVCMKVRRRKMAVHSEISARHARLCHISDLQTSFKRRQPKEKLTSRKNNRAKMAEDALDFEDQVMGEQSTSNVILNLTVLPPCHSRDTDVNKSKEFVNHVSKEHLISSDLSSINTYKEPNVTHQISINTIQEQPCTSSNVDDLFQKTLTNQNQATSIKHFQIFPCSIQSDDSLRDMRQPTFIEHMEVVPDLNRGANPNVFCKQDRMLGNTSGQIKHGSGRPRSGTSNTLAILTWCSCLLTFPLIVEMTYGAIWVNDRLQFLNNWFGMLVSSLLTAHGLSNPLLYAWRFIEWRDLYVKTRDNAARWRTLFTK